MFILCDTTDHSRCYDLVVEDRICHLGSLNEVRKRLGEVLEKDHSSLIRKIPGGEIGITPNIVKSRHSISPGSICRILNSILNNQIFLKTKYAYSFYVLPGTFEILVFQAFLLARRIKETQDDLKKVHPLNIEEIRQLRLGQKAVEDITKLAFLQGFGYELPLTEIVVDPN